MGEKELAHLPKTTYAQSTKMNQQDKYICVYIYVYIYTQIYTHIYLYAHTIVTIMIKEKEFINLKAGGHEKC